jgi:hypothetical protein
MMSLLRVPRAITITNPGQNQNLNEKVEKGHPLEPVIEPKRTDELVLRAVVSDLRVNHPLINPQGMNGMKWNTSPWTLEVQRDPVHAIENHMVGKPIESEEGMTG